MGKRGKIQQDIDGAGNDRVSGSSADPPAGNAVSGQ